MQLEFLDAQACLRLQDCSKDGLLEVPFGDQSRDASYTRLTDEVEELDPNRSRELNQCALVGKAIYAPALCLITRLCPPPRRLRMRCEPSLASGFILDGGTRSRRQRRPLRGSIRPPLPPGGL